MRRMTYIVMALAMVLGFTQCKKDQPANQTAAETVHITLNVENGSKHEIVHDGSIARVNFEKDDVIYVGDGKTYIGTLTYDGTKFSGDITPAGGTTDLYFYYVGVTPSIPSQDLTPNETQYVTTGIQNQSGKLPVLSFNHVPYGGSSYTCRLDNQCGLVKFILSQEIPTEKEIKIGGIRNDATINFVDPGITVITVKDPDEVTLKAESTTVRWAVLLPQTISNPTVTIEGYTATIEDDIEITKNMYYNTGVAITVTPISSK